VTWPYVRIALLALAFQSGVGVVAAQSPDAASCRGSVERKAVAGRIVDDETGTPMTGVWASLEARRPDTTFYSDSEVTHGTSVDPVFHRRAQLDASGWFCFTDLRSGDYRFEPRAMRENASHQAIIIRLGSTDTLKTITLRYRPFGRSPEEELLVARMLSSLDEHRRRWDASRPPHYLLRVRHDCGCLEGPPTTYEMLDGLAVATMDSNGVRHPLRAANGGRTIESLFDALRTTLLDERQWVGPVEYDPRFGSPRHYKTGIRTLLTDAWDEFTVERFDVVR
jgi:hypothetical protein